MPINLSQENIQRLTTLPSTYMGAWCATRDNKHDRQADELRADTFEGMAAKSAVIARNYTQWGLRVVAFAPAKVVAHLPSPYNFLMHWSVLTRMVGACSIDTKLQTCAKNLLESRADSTGTTTLRQVGAFACLSAAMVFTQVPVCTFVAAERLVLEMGYYAGYGFGAAAYMLKHLPKQPRSNGQRAASLS
jgi:hypothetical protein